MNRVVGLISLALLACQSTPAPGAVCERAADCASPLVCEFGRCRAQCTRNGDCGAGQQCLLDHGVGACSLDTDLGCETGVGRVCADGLTCVADHCLRACTTSDECPSDGTCGAVTGTSISVCFANDVALDADAADALDAGSSSASITALCVGGRFACAVRAGQVLCWGEALRGALGDGQGCARDAISGPSVVLVQGGDGSMPLSDVDAIACGDVFGCAHTTSDAVYCWGDQTHGQLGNGMIDDSLCADRATQVMLSTSTALTTNGVATMTAAQDHVCVLDTSGSAWCWGAGDGLIHPEGAPTLNYALATAPLTLPTGSSALWATTYGGCVQANVAVACWGANVGARLGSDVNIADDANPIANAADIVTAPMTLQFLPSEQVAANATATCGIASGALQCIGSNGQRELGVAQLLADCDCSPTAISVSMASGRYASIVTGGAAQATCGIDASHRIECWGMNDVGNAGVDGPAVVTIEGTPHWVTTAMGAAPIQIGQSVALGYLATCATTSDERDVWCWGEGDTGMLGLDVTTRVEPYAQIITLP